MKVTQIAACVKITYLHKLLVPVRLRIWDCGLEIAYVRLRKENFVNVRLRKENFANM